MESIPKFGIHFHIKINEAAPSNYMSHRNHLLCSTWQLRFEEKIKPRKKTEHIKSDFKLILICHNFNKAKKMMAN